MPKLNDEGITIVEILVVVFIITLLFTSFFLYTDPVGMKAKARDNKRISDLTTLERIITEYRIDNSRYPDEENVFRVSTILPVAESIELSSAQAGWINADVRQYNVRLPIDPINDATYNYKYYHSTAAYELNAVLEVLTNYSQRDGGNDPNTYEIGNDLTLISP